MILLIDWFDCLLDYVLDGGKVKVMILNRNEGKRSLVSAAKHFANLNNLDIKQDDVDNYLKSKINKMI